MPEIGTSGSMSGDGKRGVAEWPKLPRPSSTLLGFSFAPRVYALASVLATSLGMFGHLERIPVILHIRRERRSWHRL